MSSSSSSSDDKAHQGGAKLVPQPRRQPSTIGPPPAPAKESTNKKRQSAQVNDPDSPTPFPKGQRTAERATSKTFPTYYNAPIPMPFNMQMGHRIPSESSDSSGFYQPGRVPLEYSTFVSPDSAQALVLSSQSSNTSASVDAIAAGMRNMKLKGSQAEADKYIRYIQGQTFNLLKQVYQQEGLPSQFQQNMDRALKELTQSLSNLQGFVDKVAKEADSVKSKEDKSQRYQAAAGAQAVEIQELKDILDAKKRELAHANNAMEAMQEAYQLQLLTAKQQKAELAEQLKICEEQLEGKLDGVAGHTRMLSAMANADYRERAHFIQKLIDSNPMEKAKILEILFTTNAQAPAHNRSVSYQPPMMAMQSASATPAGDVAWGSRRPSRVTPPAPTMRRTPSAFHTGSVMRPQSGMTQSNRFSVPRSRPSTGRVDPGSARYQFDDNDTSAVSAQEFGSPKLSHSRQMALAQTEAQWTQTIEMWKEEYSKIFRMVHGWAAQYAVHVQHGQAQSIQQDAPRLWDFMCDILYPGQPEAGASHANFLLEDQQCRPFLVERLMLQYIVNNILSVEAWMGFSDETDRELKDLNDRLQSTEVFKSFIRQSIIDQIATVIGRMLSNPGFNDYRAHRINFHQQRLKTIAGPLMDPSASRVDAGFDLHAIASTSLQVSALMFQSGLSFEFSWSQTCSKFSLDFHVVKDAPADPLMLQAKQYRLKLVVTPAILFRDNRGVNNNVKRVLRSDVFVMN